MGLGFGFLPLSLETDLILSSFYALLLYSGTFHFAAFFKHTPFQFQTGGCARSIFIEASVVKHPLLQIILASGDGTCGASQPPCVYTKP